MIILLIFWRTCYAGLARGFWIELLNLATSIALPALTFNGARLIVGAVRPVLLPPVKFLISDASLADYTVFLICFTVLMVLSLWARKQVVSALKVEKFSWHLNGLGLVAGALRGLWWIAFWMVMLVACPIPYYADSVTKTSVMGPRAYEWGSMMFVSVANAFPGSQYRSPMLMPDTLGGEPVLQHVDE